MLAPYEGSPDDRGLGLIDRKQLDTLARRALARGIGLALHAIGDAANRQALDLFASIRRAHPEASLRIEHAQLLEEADISRIAALGVTASVQPSHIRDDIPAADREWGARSRLAFPFAALARSGAELAFGSDVPVGDPDPRMGLDAARRRRDRHDRPIGGWYPEQQLTAERALRAYTMGAQRACGLSGRAGSLGAGTLADLIAVEGDPLGEGPGAFEVTGTGIAGERV